jgi:hypothetical protein
VEENESNETRRKIMKEEETKKTQGYRTKIKTEKGAMWEEEA